MANEFEGRSETVLAVTVAMLALSTVFVFLRVLSRAAVVKKVSWDDYFIILAWGLAVGLSSAICCGTSFGLGRHESEVPASWQSGLRKSNYAFSVLYQPALMSTKTSILAFYLTFSSASQTFRWACYVTLFLVDAGGFCLTMVTVFQCDPVGAAFMSMIPNGAKCTDILTIYLSSVPLNIITDLILLFLPMPMLTRMRLPLKQKVIVVLTFGFGVFVTIVDVVRISYLQSASMMRLGEIASSRTAGSIDPVRETDASYYLAYSFMWSAVEVSVGIMCACVPGLKPLVVRFMPHLLRNPEDPPSQFGSLSNPQVRAAPSPMPDQVHDPNMGRAPEAADEQAVDIMEFLSGRRDFAPPAEGNQGAHEMDFLTTPEMTELHMPRAERTQTAMANTKRHTKPESSTFFDFVDLQQKKSLVHLTNRESIYPVAVVTVLFFVWGFEYGLLDTLNHQFETVANVTQGQSLGIRSAYYVGYFFGPLSIGRLVLQHWGFRISFPVGLSIYAAGCLIFWPAAVLTSWPTFLVTNFIVGFGLSILEVSANPFIALCGPAENAEIRLNISQGVQAIGSIVAPLIADKAFLHKTFNAPSLVDAQWAYLGIALATVVLALVFYYLPLPEATDMELESAAERRDGASSARFGTVPVIGIVLGLGILAQFCYVGAQEVNASLFDLYLTSVAPTFDPPEYLAVAHTAFAVSRFLAAGLGIWITPRIMLLFFNCGAIVAIALCMHLRGGAGVALMIIVFFFEGPQFALIFAQALRGQGQHVKLASALITASISGGALFSPVANIVADSRGVSYSLVVGLAAIACCAVCALTLNVVGRFRRVVDPMLSSASETDSRPRSTSSRAEKSLGLLGLKKQSHDDPQHNEGNPSQS